MIVEDDRAMRRLNRLILDRMGLFGEIFEAEDGAAAVAAARKGQPILILLDLLMPVMDGYEALPLLRAACPHARIVVLSMVHEDDLPERVRGLGADAFLDKSVDEAGLARCIRQTLAGGAGMDGNRPRGL
jgi:DNA-binding NarL/FixJ family response regulator